ncbi:MAG TPA: iron-sulfur cluster assembly scaffold protein [Sphingomonadaceae bacterium]|nr:iron-sulfur cluster assembly scaffold protein [Sphingomonadaceae bacterium]
MAEPIYTTALLRLAASIPHDARLPAPDGSSERRSVVCGSRVTVDIALDANGRVSALGLEVRACTFGQASSSLMASHAIGRSGTDLSAARDALAEYLAGRRDDAGDWPGLDVFAPARAHISRHAAIMLAFDAAAEAARLASTSRDLSPGDGLASAA